MRYRATVEFNVSANNIEEGREKAQKLADVLNKKDSKHKAWVKMMQTKNTDINVGDMYNGKKVI